MKLSKWEENITFYVRRINDFEMWNNYVINEKTVCIRGKIDYQNELYSLVTESDQEFSVRMSPVEIVDSSLQYYCSSLKGASDGARSVLGNISMLPLVIYAPLEIYMFPCFSPLRPDCIWFSLRHIRNPESLEQKSTIVHTLAGHDFILEMKKDRFERKWQRATHLRYVTEARLRKATTHYFEPNTGVNMVQHPTESDYLNQINKKP